MKECAAAESWPLSETEKQTTGTSRINLLANARRNVETT